MGRKRNENKKWVGVQAVSKSSIQIEFVYNTVRCREKIKLEPTPVNLKRAHQHRAAIMDAIARGTFSYKDTFPNSPNSKIFLEYKGENYKLKKYLETWLAIQKVIVKSSTYNDYRKIVNNILIPELGDKNLTDIKRPDVRDMCNKRSCGNKRLANIQSPLRIALQDAMTDDLISSNPLANWTYARKEAPVKEDVIDPFSEEEQKLILENFSNPQHYNLFLFAFWTGLRTSELVALEWGDIDWINNTVRVWQALTQAAEEKEEPKTRAGDRYVKILPPAMKALLAQKKHTFLMNGSVFFNPLYGKPWEGDQAIRKLAWIPALRRAKVRYRYPYQTRHTYASMMLSANESVVWVANQMGHADIRVVLTKYARWIEGKEPNAGYNAIKMFASDFLIGDKLKDQNG